jgi:hypothetical protein
MPTQPSTLDPSAPEVPNDLSCPLLSPSSSFSYHLRMGPTCKVIFNLWPLTSKSPTTARPTTRAGNGWTPPMWGELRSLEPHDAVGTAGRLIPPVRPTAAASHLGRSHARRPWRRHNNAGIDPASTWSATAAPPWLCMPQLRALELELRWDSHARAEWLGGVGAASTTGDAPGSATQRGCRWRLMRTAVQHLAWIMGSGGEGRPPGGPYASVPVVVAMAPDGIAMAAAREGGDARRTGQPSSYPPWALPRHRPPRTAAGAPTITLAGGIREEDTRKKKMGIRGQLSLRVGTNPSWRATMVRHMRKCGKSVCIFSLMC